MAGAVASFVAALWSLREAGGLSPRVAVSQARLLYVAAWHEVEVQPGYDPELDPRIDWARAVIAGARCGAKRPLGTVDDEAWVESVLKVGEFAEPGGSC